MLHNGFFIPDFRISVFWNILLAVYSPANETVPSGELGAHGIFTLNFWSRTNPFCSFKGDLDLV
jgi:ABC-type anion transport system duplicated permease subunit